jgi:hypothetical protein
VVVVTGQLLGNRESAVQTECSSVQLEFSGVEGRRVVAAFDAGRTSTDAGVLLLREVAERSGWLRRFAGCFRDGREAFRVEHSVEQLLAQRVLGIALGYEDLNDHETLRDDAVLALAAGQADVLGAERARVRDRGHALAGKSTLNRLEHGGTNAPSRYHRITHDGAAIERQFVECFLDAHATPPAEIVLDFDATDDPVHGAQEGRFFHGYYGHYCYLPLYVFCGDHVLVAKLREADQDAAAGAVEELARVVTQIRARWPQVAITVRADSGFAREQLMVWCEANGVDYVLGLARNARLQRAIGAALHEAKARCEATGEPVRIYQELDYRTRKTWSRARRVVAKAEHLPGKPNPRFVVTSLAAERLAAAPLYEQIYCARGDMENRIKEQQLDLFADRTSTATLRANQLRLWLSAMAYVLIAELRRTALAATALATAQAGTIRLRLFKVAALVRVSARRVVLSLSSSYPLQALFAQALANLTSALPRAPSPSA